MMADSIRVVSELARATEPKEQLDDNIHTVTELATLMSLHYSTVVDITCKAKPELKAKLSERWRNAEGVAEEYTGALVAGTP